MNIQYSKYTEEIREDLFQADLENNPLSIRVGIKNCDNKLRIAALKKEERVASKQHIQNSIALIKSFRQMYKALGIVGTGYTPTKQTTRHRVKWEDINSAFNNCMRTGIVVNISHKNVNEFLNDAMIMFRRRINNLLKTNIHFKIHAVFCGEYVVKKDDKKIYDFKYFHTKNVPISKQTNIIDWYKIYIEDSIKKQLDEFQERDSGWALSRILNIIFNINEFTSMLGSLYIDLPPTISN